jgi:hypothetical protein
MGVNKKVVKPVEPVMTVTMEQALRERLGELEGARERFVQEANERLGVYNGAIGEVRRLLGLPKEGEKPAGKAGPVEKKDAPAEKPAGAG